MKKIGFLFVMLMALCVTPNTVFGQENSNEYLDLALQTPKLTVIPDYVFKMTDLKELDVAFNRIGVISQDILKLTKLETLHLSGNQYLTELPDFLAEMKSLKVIYFEGMGTWSQAKKDEAVQRFAQKGIKVVLKR